MPDPSLASVAELLRKLLDRTTTMGDVQLTVADEERMEAAAAYLEAEQERIEAGDTQFRLWLDGAMRSTAADDWTAGYLAALEHARIEYSIAFRALRDATEAPNG